MYPMLSQYRPNIYHIYIYIYTPLVSNLTSLNASTLAPAPQHLGLWIPNLCDLKFVALFVGHPDVLQLGGGFGGFRV